MKRQQITPIYCAAGNKRFTEIALKYGMRYGAQLPNTHYYPPYFVDQNWRNPDRVAYMQALAETRPNRATVLDLESESQFDEVMAWAEQASQYVQEAVIVIPKVFNIIDRIPDTINGKQVVLGYSVPTQFAGTEVPLWEFGARPVHLLGGSPQAQRELAVYLNVVSADGNYAQKMANRCQYYARGYASGTSNAYFPQLSETVFADIRQDAPYFAFELSVINIMAQWAGSTGAIRWAVEDDIPQIERIARQFKSELGFVMRVKLRQQIAKRELYVTHISNNQIIGFCNWHMRRDGRITIYEIATDRGYQGEGVARGLIAALPKADIRLKCTTDNEANGFYDRMGFAHIATEDGRKRPLNVWQKLA